MKMFCTALDECIFQFIEPCATMCTTLSNKTSIKFSSHSNFCFQGNDIYFSTNAKLTLQWQHCLACAGRYNQLLDYNFFLLDFQPLLQTTTSFSEKRLFWCFNKLEVVGQASSGLKVQDKIWQLQKIQDSGAGFKTDDGHEPFNDQCCHHIETSS